MCGITTHSTGARIARLSCARLCCYCGSPRPVNSALDCYKGINGEAQCPTLG